MAKNLFWKKYLKRGRLFRFFLTFLVLSLAVFSLYNIVFIGKILPGIEIANILVEGKTKPEAEALLRQKVSIPTKIVLIYQSKTFEIDSEKMGFSYDFKKSVEAAFKFDRTGNIFLDFYQRGKSLVRSENINLEIKIDNQKLRDEIGKIAKNIGNQAVSPSVKLVAGEIVVDKGKVGVGLDFGKLESQIKEKLAEANFSPTEIALKENDPTLNSKEIQGLKARAEKLMAKTLILNFEFQDFSYQGGGLFVFLKSGGFDEEKIDGEIESLAGEVERSPQNPTFVFENGRVREFSPAKDGIKIKAKDFRKKFTDAVSSLEDSDKKEVSFEIPVDRTPPEIKTSDVNNLGIKELIGRGTSHFYHSIPSRIHNVVLATSRINGVLVKPGDTFSFDDALGDVSKFTGYKEAYIIKEGKTVLGDGGGVCQVSTTLFRAMLNAGLPVVERVAHAYRVGYYEQDSPPGLDATIYSPSPDLKFKNDTPGYILIQATADPKTATLVFELYGTKDGRTANTTKPIVSDLVAPPDDLYQDDPTLPTGTIKQIDFKAWGAKVVFDYNVQKDGQTIYQKTFYSNFRPWQAVYLRGTGPTQ